MALTADVSTAWEEAGIPWGNNPWSMENRELNSRKGGPLTMKEPAERFDVELARIRVDHALMA
jgi:hypothetical protein